MRIGIDLGGTKIEIVALHASNGKELYRQRVPTRRETYATIVQQLVDMITECEKTLGQQGTVGISMPGSISRVTGLVRNSNIVEMQGQPFGKDLEAALGGRPVRIQNDANCFVVSEATDGAAEGADVVFGIIIGTGCGGGVYANGKLVEGANGVAGEWGMIPLPYPRLFMPEDQALHSRFASEQNKWAYPYITHDSDWDEFPGPDTFWNTSGGLELWLSGTGFKRDYQAVTGLGHSTHDIIALMRQGDEKATKAFDRYCDRFARALGMVVNLFDPDVIVVGGGMSNVSPIYTEVPKRLARWAGTSDPLRTKFVPALHGDSSGVRGAAWLWGKEAI